MKVRFNSPEEFLAELKSNPPSVEPLVRITQVFTTSSFTPSIKHVSVVAGYLRQPNGVPLLVELEKYVGDHCDLAFQDATKTRERADELINSLGNAVQACGFQTHAGRYLDNNNTEQ